MVHALSWFIRTCVLEVMTEQNQEMLPEIPQLLGNRYVRALFVCWMSYMPLTHMSFHVPHYYLLLSLALMLSEKFEMSFSRTASSNSEAFTRVSSASSASSIKRSTSASGWNLSPEEEAIFERMKAMKIDAAKVTEGCCKYFLHVFRQNPDNSNSHEFELHRPSNKGTKLLLKVIKAIIIMKACLILRISLWISRCRPKCVLVCLVYAYL